MYCTKCGSQNDDNTAFCTNCGSPMGESAPVEQPIAQAPTYPAPVTNQTAAPVYGVQRSVPRCTACGYVGEWKVGPLFPTRDLVIGIGACLTVVGAPFGLGWLAIDLLVRGKKDNREKICPQCKAQNMWTFVY